MDGWPKQSNRVSDQNIICIFFYDLSLPCANHAYIAMYVSQPPLPAPACHMHQSVMPEPSLSAKLRILGTP
jgi:hypothetical protein